NGGEAFGLVERLARFGIPAADAAVRGAGEDFLAVALIRGTSEVKVGGVQLERLLARLGVPEPNPLETILCRERLLVWGKQKKGRVSPSEPCLNDANAPIIEPPAAEDEHAIRGQHRGMGGASFELPEFAPFV